ncbi:MAG: hypothetical protein U0Q03_12135 [Acidimicrobiales bacterium]
MAHVDPSAVRALQASAPAVTTMLETAPLAVAPEPARGPIVRRAARAAATAWLAVRVPMIVVTIVVMTGLVPIAPGRLSRVAARREEVPHAATDHAATDHAAEALVPARLGPARLGPARLGPAHLVVNGQLHRGAR